MPFRWSRRPPPWVFAVLLVVIEPLRRGMLIDLLVRIEGMSLKKVAPIAFGENARSAHDVTVYFTVKEGYTKLYSD